MIESLILWQVGSARAEEKARVRYQYPTTGPVIFLLGVMFVAVLFIWPIAFAYRLHPMKKNVGWQAGLWSTSIFLGLVFLVASPALYFGIGLFWGIVELSRWMLVNDV